MCRRRGALTRGHSGARVLQEQLAQQSFKQDLIAARSDTDTQDAHAYVAEAMRQLPGKYRFFAAAGCDMFLLYPQDAGEADAEAEVCCTASWCNPVAVPSLFQHPKMQEPLVSCGGQGWVFRG